MVSLNKIAGLNPNKTTSAYAKAKQGKKSTLAQVAGIRTPKVASAYVKSRTDKYSKGRRPEFLSRSQAMAFDKARRNYNARINYRIRQYMERNPGMTREQILRTGIVDIPMYKRLNELKNKSEYSKLMAMMRKSKTKKWKGMRSKELRDTLYDVIAEAYYPSPAELREIRGILNGMTDQEIVEFRWNNKALVKSFFYAYDVNFNGAEGAVSADEMEQGRKDVLDALRKYKK